MLDTHLKYIVHYFQCIQGGCVLAPVSSAKNIHCSYSSEKAVKEAV